MEGTCCVTGHRELTSEQLTKLKERLSATIDSAIQAGFVSFITGMAEGVDLLFAELIIEKKKTSPIMLIAAVPYRSRIKHGGERVRRVLSHCDETVVMCEEYEHGCFFMRNRWMVEQSDLVIAVYDGRGGGGTAYTLRHANGLGKQVTILSV